MSSAYPFPSFVRGGWGAAAPRCVTESILVWLGLKDIIAATKVCREWRAAVCSMSAQSFEVEWIKTCPVPCALMKHITAYDGRDLFIKQLAALAPRLSRVRITFGQTQTGHVLEVVARMPCLTHLSIYAYAMPWISLVPLVGCTTLKVLNIEGYIRADLTDEEIAHVRSFGHLDTMCLKSFGHNMHNTIRILVRPHTLAWKDIGPLYHLDSIDFLRALPSLTTLRTQSDLVSSDLLTALPHLTRLYVYGSHGLRNAFSGHVSLTELIVDDPDDLVWATAPALRTSLVTLTLSPLWRRHMVPTSDIRHLTNLQHLRTLTVSRDLFDENPLCIVDYSLLQVPCAAMPALECVYGLK
jgi:hypothetical protein